MDRCKGRPEAYFWFVVCFFIVFITSMPVIQASSKGKAAQQELAQNLNKLAQALNFLSGEAEEEPKKFGMKRLNYKNPFLTSLKSGSQSHADWNKLPLKKRAEVLAKEFEKKKAGVKPGMSDTELQEKYIETVKFLSVDTAATLVKTGRSMVGIKIPLEGFAWTLLLAINAITVISSSEYLARIDNLNRLTSCINIDSDKKRSEMDVCKAAHCTSMNECMATLIDDFLYVITPLFSLAITGAQLGDKRVPGIFPLVFQVFAPQAKVTEQITQLADALYLLVQLFGQMKVALLMAEEKPKVPSSVKVKERD